MKVCITINCSGSQRRTESIDKRGIFACPHRQTFCKETRVLMDDISLLTVCTPVASTATHPPWHCRGNLPKGQLRLLSYSNIFIDSILSIKEIKPDFFIPVFKAPINLAILISHSFSMYCLYTGQSQLQGILITLVCIRVSVVMMFPKGIKTLSFVTSSWPICESQV